MEAEARSRLLLEPLGRPFDAFSLDEKLKLNLKRIGLKRTTIFQDFCLPHILAEDEELLVEAPRGSGKATAYLLGSLQYLLRHEGRALILTPQEKRARSLAQEAETLAEDTGISTLFFGGSKEELSFQMKELEKGARLIISTPRWLTKIFKWRLLDPSSIRLLVVDEPEAMLKELSIVEGLRPQKIMVFLNQVSYEAVSWAYRLLQRPFELFWGRRPRRPGELRFRLYHVSQKEKFALLLELLKEMGRRRVIIFTANELVAKALSGDLKRHGFLTLCLLPESPPRQRLELIRRFNSQRAVILVTTDESVPYLDLLKTRCLINYDLPATADEFLLRIGSLPSGAQVINLCDETGAFSLEEIEKALGEKMTVVWARPKREARRQTRASSTSPRRQGHWDSRSLSP